MNTEEKEVWKDIPGFEGRNQVSNLGRVKSLKRNGLVNTIIMSPRHDKVGYLRVNLRENRKLKTYTVHRLVIWAFVGFKEGLVIDHINNIKSDNRLCNLQQITNRKNCSKDRKRTTSKYTGVSRYGYSKKWTSQIYINGNPIILGYFETEIQAHSAYKNKLRELGE